MTCTDYTVRPESISDAAKIESLTETVFGPGMRARAAYFLREGVDHTMALSFVVESRDAVVGTVRLTPVVWGKTVVLMLGPLAVLQSLKGKGIGKLLMHTAVDAANVRAKGETELSSDLGGPGAGIGGLPLEGSWRFYAPRLGPISSVQEDTLGPILGFLTGSTSDPRVGEGTKLNPLKVLVVVGGFSHRNSDGGSGPNP